MFRWSVTASLLRYDCMGVVWFDQIFTECEQTTDQQLSDLYWNIDDWCAGVRGITFFSPTEPGPPQTSETTTEGQKS